MLPFNFLLGINKNLKNPFALFVCSAPLLFVLSPLLVHPFPDRVESPPNQPSASEQPKSKNIASLKNRQFLSMPLFNSVLALTTELL